ncbi:tryptophan synthase subunit alpha [Pseudochryseolinea flava]|uniref:Tryptophan synthase alpha chain n=1 Tax=Pseudochryseolinea flava TaxID=2059302 RepID=A0A364XV61_9BACT|nr:tryptophan synthase subunit alpha [Pseudochryseolinea flava]RAV98053.1 tryptophan synthase subunit alpha [Pseudochryseolinea flava]
MKNRITELFSKKKDNLLNVYYTAGYPKLNDTIVIAKALEAGGADLIEIGIPFSDPVADGPTIQASNKVAIDNGMNVSLLLAQVRTIRKDVKIPIILMGYLNPVMQYGVEKFVKDASAAGVDGLILPDMPIHVYEEEFKELFHQHNLCNTFLISPTTSEERIRKIDHATHGFIYAVSSSSITGAKGEFTQGQLDYFKRLKDLKLNNPFMIGFGISNNASFKKAAAYSAGAIVGSAFITLLGEAKDLDSEIQAFVKSLKG